MSRRGAARVRSAFGIDRTASIDHSTQVPVPSSADSGLDALREAAAHVGLQVVAQDTRQPDQDVDLVLISPTGARQAVMLKRLSLLPVDGLARRLKEWNAHLKTPDAIGVVVADRITRDARRFLREAGWGWLDLRGHLHLTAPGVFIDTNLPPLKPTAGRSEPLAGQVGLEIAALILSRPKEQAAVRPLARETGRAPSSVSDVLASMREAQLLDNERRPVVPPLFWELASHWKPTQANLTAVPAPGTGEANAALRLGFDKVEETTGWALGDTRAAAAYGAPVGTRGNYPPDFYVPDAVTLRRAVQYLGLSPDRSSRAATVKVAPVPMVCSRRVDAAGWANEEWPLAQPLFVALDLAADAGRGHEILETWEPPEPWHRVW